MTTPSSPAAICFVFCFVLAIGYERENTECAEDWPQWRGPNQDGVSLESDWTTDWGDGPRQLWKRDLEGGHGTVAVVGERVYAIGTSGDTNGTDTVYCLSSDTGETLWKHEYQRPERSEKTPTPRGTTNSTPTVHDGHVYTYSHDAQLFCLNAETGEVVWKRELIDELDAKHPQYGHNCSPVVIGDLVIVLARLPDASIAAFDKNTGKEVWRTLHKTRRGALGGFWSTPVHRMIDGKSCLVYLPGLAVVGLDPATGDTQWKYDFIEEAYPLAERGAVAASPVVSGDRVFFPFHPDHGRGFSACIEVTDGQPTLLWKSMKLAHWWQDAVLHNGHIYAVDQGPAAEGAKAGALYCYDLATGEERWSIYSMGKSSRGTLTKGGMLTFADGKLILMNGSGSLMVASVNDLGCELLASTQAVRPGQTWTVPVLAGGRIYCRGERSGLICLDVRNPASSDR